MAGAFARRFRRVVTVTPESIGSFFVGHYLRLIGVLPVGALVSLLGEGTTSSPLLASRVTCDD